MQTLGAHHAKGMLIKFIFEKMNKINGGRGMGAAHSELESAAQGGEFEMYNWVISTIKNFSQICYQRGWMRMLLRPQKKEL